MRGVYHIYSLFPTCSVFKLRGNASNYRGGFMVVERTINVGFHSNFGMFKRSRHSKIPTRLAITLEPV